MIQVPLRHTKVIWSVEGKRLAPFEPRHLSSKDVSALRIIYNQEDTKDILDFLHRVESYRSEGSFDCPIMLDVAEKPQGLIAKMTESREVSYGEELYLLDEAKQQGKDHSLKKEDIKISCQNFSHLFSLQDLIYVGFGSAVLRVIEVSGLHAVKVKVIYGGVIDSLALIHVPSKRQELSLKDFSQIDLNAFKDLSVDYVILPGMGPKELSVIKKKISSKGHRPWIIVKIDAKHVYDQLDALLHEADGVMICRRELALTFNPAVVPMVGKEVTQKAFAQAKIVIMASEILASMKHNPTPTRAEVSDIANAVIDGADGIVLSEDIAAGSYEEKAHQTCIHIIDDLEKDKTVNINWQRADIEIENELDAVAAHAYKTALRLQAKAIVCITKSGNTALRLASFRLPTPIIAVTFSEEVRRKLSLVFGIEAIVLETNPNLDEVLPAVSDRLKRTSWLTSGDLIVFVTLSLSSVGHEASNLFTVQRLI